MESRDGNRIGPLFTAGMLLVATAASVLAGCGRDAVQSCASDSDCAAGGRCIQGSCTGGPDGGTGDAGQCFVRNDRCVRAECGGDGACSFPDCELGCEPWQERDGCSCTAKSCQSADACGGFACLEGQCGPCSSAEDCPENSRCADNGRCLDGGQCTNDSDCAPRRRCNSEGTCVERGECLVDDECESGETCFNGQCTSTPDCESDDECPSGSECVGGKCYVSVCRGPDDCAEGEVCDAGECVQPDVSAERCFLATDDQKISENQRVRLEAFAVDENGDGVAASFEWKSSRPEVAAAGVAGEWSEVDFVAGGSEAGTTDVTARLASDSQTECEGSVALTNLGDVDSESLRVVVEDAEDGTAVEDARVVLSGGGFARTNGSGVATLSRPNGPYTVSVFDDGYNYVSLRGVQSPDLRIPLLPKEGEGPTAGFTGSFDTSNLHTSGDVTLGLAGASISGGLLQVGLDELLGEPFVRDVQTPGGSAEVALPGGMVLNGQVAGFDANVKSEYFATAPEGPRLGWGLAGRISGLRLIQIIQNGNQSNPLPALLPLFNRFDHSVRPLQLSERSRVTDASDIDGDGDTSEKVPDYRNFPTVGLSPSVRQRLVTSVAVSNFPKLPGGRAEFAVLIGGNLLSSTGFVPLGISATSDEDGDGAPDLRKLSMAPPHGPLTGGRFAVMALAFRDVGFDPTEGVEFSEEFSASLWTRDSLAKQVGLGVFPNASTGTVDRDNRTVDIEADAGPLYRVRLVGEARTWEIWTVGSSGQMGTYQETIDVPASPGPATDLMQSADSIYLDAVEVSVSIDDLAKATGIGLRRAGLVATAYNRTKLD